MERRARVDHGVDFLNLFWTQNSREKINVATIFFYILFRGN